MSHKPASEPGLIRCSFDLNPQVSEPPSKLALGALPAIGGARVGTAHQGQRPASEWRAMMMQIDREEGAQGAEAQARRLQPDDVRTAAVKREPVTILQRTFVD